MSAGMRLISAMSPNADPFYLGLCEFLSSRLGETVEFVNDPPWQERIDMLLRGQVDVGFICGLPYIQQLSLPQPTVDLVAAPVMTGDRYRDQPIYFSDVIVRHDSDIMHFSDLRGRSWAYNEPNSQSGYNIMRYHLYTLGETRGFFGRIAESGAHLSSIEMVLDGGVDAACIDSIVLDRALRNRPTLRDRLRIIAELGPSPIPPVVVSSSMTAPRRQALMLEMLSMHEVASGRELLQANHVRRFAQADHDFYQTIVHMARMAEAVTLQQQVA